MTSTGALLPQDISARATSVSSSLLVESRVQVADGIVSLSLVDPGGQRLAPWTPGSHIDLFLPNGMSRQYSLCGDRWDPYRYRVAILHEHGGRGGSRWIHENLREGAVLGYGGPRNHFPLVPAERYLFIAGGIGITPILPMVEQAVRTGRPWKLLYGGRSRQSMAYLPDLEKFGSRVRITPEDEAGMLDLTAAVSSWAPGTKIYCCGPSGLLEALEATCADLPPYTLHTERFTATAVSELSQDRPFTLKLARSGTEIDVAPGVSVLDALTDAGVGIVSSCRQGTCGTCEVTVTDGVPDHRDSVLSETDRAAGDCMISCVSRAQTPSLTLDL
ncbi:PDR/VanB family oxidoreductase [Prescottella equi]|uniref:PDR/VanB family oxidoreductase n=1 Tax=Rhodococcus hoagii TaxID=43767 RepID=UPI0009C05F83